MRKLYELMSAEGLLPKVTFFAYLWMILNVTGLVPVFGLFFWSQHHVSIKPTVFLFLILIQSAQQNFEISVRTGTGTHSAYIILYGRRIQDVKVRRDFVQKEDKRSQPFYNSVRFVILLVLTGFPILLFYFNVEQMTSIVVLIKNSHITDMSRV